MALRNDGPGSTGFWEWQAPLAALLIGVVALAALFATALGVFDLRVTLILFAIILLLYLPITVGLMFPVAYLLSVSFGFIHTAILKIAAIVLLSLAIDWWARYYDHPLVGWIFSVLLTLALFSYFFDLDARETVFFRGAPVHPALLRLVALREPLGRPAGPIAILRSPDVRHSPGKRLGRHVASG